MCETEALSSWSKLFCSKTMYTLSVFASFSKQKVNIDLNKDEQVGQGVCRGQGSACLNVMLLFFQGPLARLEHSVQAVPLLDQVDKRSSSYFHNTPELLPYYFVF